MFHWQLLEDGQEGHPKSKGEGKPYDKGTDRVNSHRWLLVRESDFASTGRVVRVRPLSNDRDLGSIASL
jgi:hypothetical protein